MIVSAEIESYARGVKELTEEGLELIRGIFPMAHKSGDYIYDATGLVEINLLQEIIRKVDVEVKIKPFKGNAFFARNGDIDERLSCLEGQLELLRETHTVQMHLPNFSLLTFNQVSVLEDYCTNRLQEKLNEGWRIIAVCPPLSERRPTYIVGRFIPEGESNGRVKACQ